jgi:hypothetical protein
VDAKSLEIAKDIGWNPDHNSFFKAQMAWNSHREADRSAKQTHAAMMEAADLRSRPELSKESRKLAQHAARSAGVEGVDVTERLLAPSSTRRSAHASAASGASSEAGDDWSAPAADFRPQISAASIAMVERRSELEAVRRPQIFACRVLSCMLHYDQLNAIRVRPGSGRAEGRLSLPAVPVGRPATSIEAKRGRRLRRTR